MRNLPTVFENRIKKLKQVPAEQSDPRLTFIVSRPKTALINSRFLETQKVQTTGSITAIDIAVAHQSYNKRDTEIYIAYIESGIAKVKKALWKAKMKDHVWSDIGVAFPASDVAICYNSKCVDYKHGKYEYLTEPAPWLFWIDGGNLYGKKIDAAEPVILANSNVTKVSAVRATYSEVDLFNTGLIIFFIVSGQLYYRQLIDGTWYDAELVTFGPAGTSYVDIAVSRTWDYRVVVQGITAASEVYELYTQYSGIGTRVQEHISVKSVNAKGKSIEVEYIDAFSKEHINISSVTATGKRIYALSSKPISARNISDGSGNYGIYLEIMFDHPLHDISGQAAAFKLIDSNGVTYVGESVNISANGLTLLLTMSDFNLAARAESASIHYTPGEVMSPVVPLEAFEYPVELTGLVAPVIPVPVLEDIYNE